MSPRCGSWRSTSHLKWRLMPTKGAMPPAPPRPSAARCTGGVHHQAWLDPHILWRPSCQTIRLHETTLSALFPSSPVHIPTLLCVCVGSHACNFSGPLFFSPMAKKEGGGGQWNLQMLLLCCMHDSKDTSLSSQFPPRLTDDSYQTVCRYCG